MRALARPILVCLLAGCPGGLELRRDAGLEAADALSVPDEAPAPDVDGPHLEARDLTASTLKPDLAAKALKPDLGAAPPAGANSGALCSPAAPACPNAGEACVYYTAGATKGLCVLMGCTPNALCPVANPATQLSACFGSSGAQHFCAWLCEHGGKSYACPSPTGFACVALNPAQPDVKYCVP